MSSAHLTYFNGRGHGERVRYALAAAGVPFTESLLTQRGDMAAVREKCLFGQVPLLELLLRQVLRQGAEERHREDEVRARGRVAARPA